MKNVFITLLLLSLISCSITSIRNENSKIEKIFSAEDQDTVITIEQTGFFEDQPNYRIVIYGDGKIYFEGISSTKIKGLSSTIISKADVKSIIDKSNKISFFDMRNRYKSDVEQIIFNAPVLSISIKLKNKYDKITIYLGDHPGSNIGQNKHYYSSAFLEDFYKLSGHIALIIHPEQWR